MSKTKNGKSFDDEKLPFWCDFCGKKFEGGTSTQNLENAARHQAKCPSNPNPD